MVLFSLVSLCLCGCEVCASTSSFLRLSSHRARTEESQFHSISFTCKERSTYHQRVNESRDHHHSDPTRLSSVITYQSCDCHIPVTCFSWLCHVTVMWQSCNQPLTFISRVLKGSVNCPCWRPFGSKKTMSWRWDRRCDVAMRLPAGLWRHTSKTVDRISMKVRWGCDPPPV